MNILIIGSGGREHTLAWKLKQSPLCSELFIAPGNAGTALMGTNIPLSTTDFEGLTAFCLENKIEMLVVGPEDPLVKGSKAYAKAFMDRHQIPTAAYREFDATNFEAGISYIKNHSLPIVLKADGLAAGKGVVICTDHAAALLEFEQMIQQAKFGESGKRVVIEQFLDGIELSMFVLTDGKNYVLLPEAKDYKRIGIGDKGLNTGGMGAVSPVPFVDEAYILKVKKAIIEPTIAGLLAEKLEYKGVVFIGLINVKGEPMVIEYNCRFGDPETEVIIPRIENDLVEIFLATSQQRLDEITIKTSPMAAVTVVAVSGGYPNQYVTGKEILGLMDAELSGTIVFHSGTLQDGAKVLTNGGRVLAVTSTGSNITAAAAQSNRVLEKIRFDGIYFRDDIGYEFR